MANGRRRQKGSDLHSQIVDALMEKVRTDPYPSTTHLDLLEEMLEDEDVEGYAESLLDKVRRDPFPSLDHLQRLRRLA